MMMAMVVPTFVPRPMLMSILMFCVVLFLTWYVVALKTVNEIMRRRGDWNLDARKKPQEQLEECMRLLMNQVADVSNL